MAATPAERIAEALGIVVRAVVTMPEAVRVEVVTTDGPVVLLVHADPADVGRVVGRGGREIAGLRNLVARMAARTGVRVLVDVAGSRRGRTDGASP